MNGQTWPWQGWGSQTTTQSSWGGRAAQTTDPEHATLSQSQPSPPTTPFADTFRNLMTQFSQFGNAQSPSVFSSGRATVYTQPQNNYHNKVPSVATGQDTKVYSAENSIHIEFKGRSKPSSSSAGENQFQTQNLANAGQSQYQHNAGQSQYQSNAGQSQYQPNAAQSQYQPNAGQSQYQPNAGQSQYQPNAGQSQYHPNTGQSQYRPNAGQSQYQPNAGQSQYQPNAGQTQYQPNVAQSQYQLNAGQSQYQPNADQSQYQPNVGQSQYQPDSNFAYQTVGSSNSGGEIQNPSNPVYQSGLIQTLDAYPTPSIERGQQQSPPRGYQESTNVQSQPQNAQATNSVAANKAYLMQALLKQLQEQPMELTTARQPANEPMSPITYTLLPPRSAATGNTNQQGSNSQLIYQSQLNNGPMASNGGNSKQSAYQWPQTGQTKQQMPNTGSWPPNDQTNQPVPNTGSWPPNGQANQQMSNTRSAGPQNVYQLNKNMDSTPSISNTKRNFQRNFVSNPVSYNPPQPTAATYIASTQRHIPTERTNLVQRQLPTIKSKLVPRQMPTERNNLIQRQISTERSNLVQHGSVKAAFIAALQRTMANQAQRNTESKPTVASWINNSNNTNKQQTYIQQAPAPTNGGSSSQNKVLNNPRTVHNFRRIEVTTNAGPIAQDYLAENGIPFLQQAKVRIQQEPHPKNQDLPVNRNHMNNIQGVRINGKAELSKNLRNDASSFHQQLQAAGMNAGALKEPPHNPLPPTVSTERQIVGQKPQLPDNIKSGVWNIVSSFLKMQSLSDLKALMKSQQLLGSLQGANGKTSNPNTQLTAPQPKAYQPKPNVQFKPQPMVEKTASKPSFSQLESQRNVKQLFTDGSETNQIAAKKSNAWTDAMDAVQVVATQQQAWTDVAGVNEPAVKIQAWSGGSQSNQGVPTEKQMYTDARVSDQASQMLSGVGNNPNVVTDTKQIQMLSSNFGTDQAVSAQSQNEAQSWSSASDQAAVESQGQSWTDSNAFNQGPGPQQGSGVSGEYSFAAVDQPQTNSVQKVSSSSRTSTKKRRPSDIGPSDNAGGLSVGLSIQTDQVNKPYSDPGSVPSGPRFSSVSATSYSDIKKQQPETKPQNLRSSIGTAQQARLNARANNVENKVVTNERFSEVGNEPYLGGMQSSKVRDKSASQSKQDFVDTSYRSTFRPPGSLDHIHEYVDLSSNAQKQENSLFPYRNGGTILYQNQRNEPKTTTSAPWDNVYNPRKHNQRKSKAPATDIQELPPWEVPAVMQDPLTIPKIPRPPSIGQNRSDSGRRGNPFRDPLPVGDSPASRANNMPSPAPHWRTNLGSSTLRDTRPGGREPWSPGPGAERHWGSGPGTDRHVGPLSGPDRYNMSGGRQPWNLGPGAERPWGPGPATDRHVVLLSEPNRYNTSGGREPWNPRSGPERPWGPGPGTDRHVVPLSGPDRYNISGPNTDKHGGPNIQRLWSPDPYFTANTPPLPMPRNPPTPAPMTTPPTTTTTTTTVRTTTRPTTVATPPPPQHVAPYVASRGDTNGGIPRPKPPPARKNKRPKKKYTGPLRIKPLKQGDPPNWDAFDVVGEFTSNVSNNVATISIIA